MSLQTQESERIRDERKDAVALSAILTEARAAAADIALITDADQAITYVSDSFTAITGFDLADLEGLNCRILQGPGTDPDTKAQMREVLASGEVFEGQILNYRKDGSAFWTALKIIPMRVGGGPDVTHFVSVQRDITNEIALLRQVQTQALNDHVTGLPNRAAAEQALAEVVKAVPPHPNRAQRQALTAAVGLIDLDDFRVVNNTLGHAAGDAVLQQWSTRVLSRLREGDVLARMGGDEFLLILRNINRNTSEQDLPGILDRIHEAVEHPFLVDGEKVRIGMSMGIALVPADGTDTRTILRHADQALYTAKERHKQGGFWWETTEQSQAHSRPVSGNDSAAANGPGSHAGKADVARQKISFEDYRGAVRTGKILVHFQPVVDLRNGTVTLFEALARLQLPDGSLAHPFDFLPHLNADDLHVLFIHVLDQGLGLIGAWDREGVRPNMAVNLPPEILHDQALPGTIKGLMEAHGIEPDGLGLELLESHTLGLEAQRMALQELTNLGVHLAMDDLGSGHSSLRRLSSFPFTAIKLDRGLFENAYERPLETLSVMATLIQMGRDLGMTVVIEGLGDKSLTEAATTLGAPLGQGYFLGEPMSREECGSWFDSFSFDLHQSPVQTPLGALAYHWQFARLAAPHPLSLESCPLTPYIETTRTGLLPDDTDPEVCSEVKSWHALHHTSRGAHASSRLFTDWLTQQIRIPDSAGQ